MSLGYLVSPALQIEDVNGKPLTGGYLRVYEAGTQNIYITYRDFMGDLNTASVELDAKGMAILIADDGNLYDIYCKDRNGVDQWSRLNVKVGGGSGGGGGGTEYVPGEGINISGETISVDTSVIQPILTAGDNVSIVENRISAYDTTYTATEPIFIDGTDVQLHVGSGLSVTSDGLSVDTSAIQTVLTFTDGISESSGVVSLDNPVPGATASDAGKVLKVDSSGNAVWGTDSDTTYTFTDGITESSGVVSLDNPTPAPSGSDSGKVLSVVDTSGTLGWVSQPTFTQQNADWTATDGVQEILHKPAEKSLAAGSGITITEGSDSITIAASGSSLPAYTASDSGKTLTVNSAGTDVGWAAIPSDIFEASVGITTYADVDAAYTAGKSVFANYNGHRAPLSYKDGNNAYHFVYVWHKTSFSYSDQSDEVVDYTVDSNGWTSPTSHVCVDIDVDSNSMSKSYSNGTLTVGVLRPIPTYSGVTDVGKFLAVKTGGGFEWTNPKYPACADLFGLQTYTITSSDITRGYALVPVFQLPYGGKESEVSCEADLIAFDLIRSNAHRYFAGVTKWEAFLGTSDATKGYMFRRVENPATTLSDSGAALTEAADMWRWHLIHHGGRNSSEVTHLLIKAYFDNTVQVDDQFEWEGELVQFNA